MEALLKFFTKVCVCCYLIVSSCAAVHSFSGSLNGELGSPSEKTSETTMESLGLDCHEDQDQQSADFCEVFCAAMSNVFDQKNTIFINSIPPYSKVEITIHALRNLDQYIEPHPPKHYLTYR